MFAPGDKLEYGHYTVLRELGAGGMGVVYHCRDEFLQREIAIKMLLPELMADDDTVEIFRQEARLAAQLEHQNIVTIHNIGIENKESKTHHYIAMEFLPGGSLKNRIENNESIALEQSLEWMKQMTIGLNYAHKRGVVHQDIKPDNVFITHDGNLKIGDFGLALIASGVAVERAVQGKGTPAYMSPELCRGDPQDARSDIYSLGAVFFELLTREKPYKATGMIEMAMKHATAPVPSAKKVSPDIPDVLDKAIQKMMAKSADDRYQSLAEVLAILEKLLLQMQVARLGMSTSKTGLEAISVATPEKPVAETAGTAEKEKAAVAEKTTGEKINIKQKEPVSAKTDDVVLDVPKPPAKPKVETPVKAESAAKAASLAVDPLDDLLDTLLAEQHTIAPTEAKKEKAAPPAAKKAEPVAPAPERKSAEVARPEGMIPNRFNEDVTTDIDAVFQSRVRAEAAAMAEAAKAAREAAEIGKTVHGPAGTPAGKTTDPAVMKAGRTTGQQAASKARQPQVLWTFKTMGPIGWSSAPVISKNRKTIFVTSCDGWLYALDAQTGHMVWRVDSGGAIISSPVITDDRIIITSTNGNVVAVNHGGDKLWDMSTSSPLVATPVVCQEDLLVSCMDGLLKCIRLEDGHVRWSYRTEGPLVSPPQVLETLVFVASKDKALHAVSLEKGWRQWSFSTEAPIVSSPLVSTDSVYVGSTDGHMYAVEAESGKMIWRYSTETPIVSKGTLEFTSVTVCSEDKWVHCIEKYKGILVWKSRLHSEVMASLVSNSGNLYVANRSGWLQCFNLKNGELRWQMEVRNRLESPPLVSGKSIYLGKVNGEVAAYALPE